MHRAVGPLSEGFDLAGSARSNVGDGPAVGAVRRPGYRPFVDDGGRLVSAQASVKLSRTEQPESHVPVASVR